MHEQGLSIAGSAQVVQLVCLADPVYQDLWKGNGQLKLGTRVRGPRRDAYIWDLHRIAQDIGDEATAAYRVIGGENFNPIWLSNFSEEDSPQAIDRLNTIFPLAAYTRELPSERKVSGSLTGVPLIGPGGVNTDTLEGETSLWRAMVYPFAPVMFTSSILVQRHFGPSFLNQASLTATKRGVTISASWEGGKCLLAPTIGVPQFEVVQGSVDGTTPDQHIYRTAHMRDCLYLPGVDVPITDDGTDIRVQFGDVATSVVADETASPTMRVVSMSLSVNQSIKFETPPPGPGTSDASGPRFASLENRVVRGEITYYSRDTFIDPPRSSALTMYFGGPFVFPMTNVDWLLPSLEAEAGEGFLHKVRFIARAVPNASTVPLQGNGSASEFDIN